MSLINCEVNLFLTWSPTCVITDFTGEERFKITGTKLFVLVVEFRIMQNYFSN